LQAGGEGKKKNERTYCDKEGGEGHNTGGGRGKGRGGGVEIQYWFLSQWIVGQWSKGMSGSCTHLNENLKNKTKRGDDRITWGKTYNPEKRKGEEIWKRAYGITKIPFSRKTIQEEPISFRSNGGKRKRGRSEGGRTRFQSAAEKWCERNGETKGFSHQLGYGNDRDA